METKKYLPDFGDLPNDYASREEMDAWDDERRGREFYNMVAETFMKFFYCKKDYAKDLPNNGIISLHRAEKIVKQSWILSFFPRSAVLALSREIEEIRKQPQQDYERVAADA